MKSILFSIFTLAVFSLAGFHTIQAQERVKSGGYVKSQPQAANAVSSTVVINEIYGGGGSATATYQRDYIELLNISSTLQNISGWSVQYASATGTSWTVTTIPANTVLRPGDTYLVAGASGAGLNPLPAFNVAGSITASNTAGKVALVSNSTPLSGNGCPIAAPIVDFVGYGATANCSETAPAPSPSSTTSSLNRTLGLDTDTNGADFTNAAPTPQAAIQPTAATATIEGRVVTSTGSGISKVNVTVTDSEGNVQTVLTGGFGYFTFEGLQTGETYILSVSSKRYQFNPSTRAVTLNEDLRDLEFTAEP